MFNMTNDDALDEITSLLRPKIGPKRGEKCLIDIFPVQNKNGPKGRPWCEFNSRFTVQKA